MDRVHGPGPRGGPWTRSMGPWGSMGWSMDPGPCFVYVHFCPGHIIEPAVVKVSISGYWYEYIQDGGLRGCCCAVQGLSSKFLFVGLILFFIPFNNFTTKVVRVELISASIIYQSVLQANLDTTC